MQGNDAVRTAVSWKMSMLRGTVEKEVLLIKNGRYKEYPRLLKM